MSTTSYGETHDVRPAAVSSDRGRGGPRDDSQVEPTWPGKPWLLVGTRTISAALVLLAIELSLKHIGGYGWWVVHERSARYGWRMLPDQDGRSRDLTVVESINGMGYRDREWTPPAGDGGGGWERTASLFRVAVVGDSMTYGTGVPVENTYSRDLERRLQEVLDGRGSGRRALVMNFAVQNYRMEQMARVYEDQIRPFRPDLFIVPVHAYAALPMAPSADEPEYDLRRFVKRTAVHDLLSRHVFRKWMPPVPVNPEAFQATEEWNEISRTFRLRPDAPENRPFFEAACRRLEGMRRQVRGDGGRLLVVGMPSWQEHFDAGVLRPGFHYAAWLREAAGDVLFARPWPAFEALMEPVIDDMRAHRISGRSSRNLSRLRWVDGQGHERGGDELDAAARSPYLPTDGAHFSSIGHRAIAEAIFDVVLENGLLDR